MDDVVNETENSPVYGTQGFTGVEIPLSNWSRSLCESLEYPAFDDPEPVTLPDTLTEQFLDFSGFACYETTFVLDSLKSLSLDISDAAGSVEVFMNGETAGMKLRPPYHYDLSDLARQGKNYLAIEVAVFPEQKSIAIEAQPLEKTRHDKNITNHPCIIGTVRLYSN
jgi:hypothetical protein